MASLVVVVVVVCVACGSSSAGDDGGLDAAPDVAVEAAVVDSGPDVDNGAPSTTYPAFTPDMPQVVNALGPILATPKIVPVYFGNDDTSFTGQLTTFLNALPASTYWPAQVAEYGVGALTVGSPVQLVENALATTTDADIKTWLASKIAGSAVPAPDASTLYVIFYPSATTAITYSSMASCVNFYGYHESLVYQTTNVAYAVLPRCTGFHALTGVNAVTAVTTHEIVESVTDPYASQSAEAYHHVDDAHFAFELAIGGSEVGDLCSGYDASIYVPSDVGFDVQRNWSNTAAKAYHDPCVPPSTVYYNSVPVLPDTTTIGAHTGVKAVNVPVGTSRTIDVELFSEADTKGPWTVQAYDAATLNGTGPATLSFSWDRPSGQNGEKLHLTIKALAQSPNGLEGFYLKSHLGPRTTTWIGVVQN